MEYSEDSPQREVDTNTGPPQKYKNSSNKQPNPMPTRAQGTTTKTAQSK